MAVLSPILFHFSADLEPHASSGLSVCERRNPKHFPFKPWSSCFKSLATGPRALFPDGERSCQDAALRLAQVQVAEREVRSRRSLRTSW